MSWLRKSKRPSDDPCDVHFSQRLGTIKKVIFFGGVNLAVAVWLVIRSGDTTSDEWKMLIAMLVFCSAGTVIAGLFGLSSVLLERKLAYKMIEIRNRAKADEHTGQHTGEAS